MNTQIFVMEASAEEALEYIAGRLTQSQRRLLVTSLVQAGEGERALVRDANEHTVRALKAEPAPLVGQEGMHRFLTPLGRDVARHLNRTGDWEVPVTEPAMPEFREPKAVA